MSDEQWQLIKRKMQVRWGVRPQTFTDEPSWTALADRVRDRAVRVGEQLIDVVRDIARETTSTFSEAGTVLQDDANRVGGQIKTAGGKARTGIDSAKSTLSYLADSVRDGLIEGVSKGKSGKDFTRSMAETLGMAAGAILSTINPDASNPNADKKSQGNPGGPPKS